jgi:hypothetical protein
MKRLRNYKCIGGSIGILASSQELRREKLREISNGFRR